MDRREFLATAAALGASLAWGNSHAAASRIRWTERRDLYPEGVASGDPYPDSVLLWTRRPSVGAGTVQLTLEVAEDETFEHVIAETLVSPLAENDWTCRVLAAGLKPAHVYWYRFTDANGFGSRVGRTITAPTNDSSVPVRFAFVSCQNVAQGAQNAYRRMIWEDERAVETERLGFVLHLGDFVYEITWYPEDRPQGMYSRTLRDVVRFPHGEKVQDFHIPTTVEDYRLLYRGYLKDPDLQDARARWPFVCLWDNHEFSWKGWQSLQRFYDGVRPAQTRKVAANRVWFEYQPARIVKQGNDVDRYHEPPVHDSPIQTFDDHGIGQEPYNLAAIDSMKIFRTLRFGRYVELILTDNRSFRSECVMDRDEAAAFKNKAFPYVVPDEVVAALDAGRSYPGGAPKTIRLGDMELPNPRKNSPPQTMLGVAQKEWFLERLGSSTAVWKLWGNTVGMLDWRSDFHNLPKNLGPPWPGASYAIFAADDWAGYRIERSQILDFVRDHKITGFATLAGDRHSFFAGVLSPSLPPKEFKPVGVEFITGSVSAPGIAESVEYNIPADQPLRALYIYQPAATAKLQPAVNMTGLHGVRASLALQRTDDLQQALKESNPEVAPHLSFLDLGGHGYAVVVANKKELQVEFVCIPRPLQRAGADGGPLAYRVTHTVKLWNAGETPSVKRLKMEGELPLSI
jgi:alkaline phosphatase D